MCIGGDLYYYLYSLWFCVLSSEHLGRTGVGTEWGFLLFESRAQMFEQMHSIIQNVLLPITASCLHIERHHAPLLDPFD